MRLKKYLVSFFRRHISIGLANIYYAYKKKIRHKECTWPHWLRYDRRNKSTVVILHCQDCGYGIGAVFTKALHLREWCNKRGYLLYICYNPYSNSLKISDKNNIWSNVFVQEISAKEIKNNNENIILFDIGFIPEDKDIRRSIDEQCINYYLEKNDFYTKQVMFRSKSALLNVYKYGHSIISPNRELIDSANAFWSKCGLDNKRVLGVIMREDFSQLRYMTGLLELQNIYQKHPDVPEPQKCVEYVYDLLKAWNCDCVFVATRYMNTLLLFENILGENRVFYIDRHRVDYDYVCAHLNDKLKKKANYLEALDASRSYMEELILISKCDSIISAPSSGSWLVGGLKKREFSNLAYFPDLRLQDNMIIIDS